MTCYRIIVAMLALFVVTGIAGAPQRERSAAAAESENYSLEAKNAASVVGTLAYDVAYPDFQAREWIVCASQAPTLPGQTKVRTALSPSGEPAKDESDLARSLLVARVSADAEHPLSKLPIRITYEATLRSRKLRRGTRSGRAATLTPEERAMYLADRGFIDFKSPVFEEWLKSRKIERRANEGEIAFARRIFLGLKSGMTYDASLPRDFHASASCQSSRAECGGLSVLFASIMRANNIPARTLWGRWAYAAEPGKSLANRPYFQTHVKAEFFARGVGWVPVDLSSAILHDKSPQGLRFFGNDPGDFITFHIDPNFVIDSRLFGVKNVAQLQTPTWWLRGKGSLKNVETVQDWQVKRAKPN
jgi:transglutaminase-like putative cysteine protease